VPRFGKDKDASRKEELDRQAAEEVERLTRRGGPPGMGGGGGMPGMPGMGPIGIPSPLERIAEEVRGAPRPSMRKAAPPRRPSAQQQQAFTPLPSGDVGSSFGPGGLNPGPRGMGAGMAPPPPAFGGGAYDEDYGGPVTGPPVYHAEPDEEEEMTITEMALMDHAERRGYNPEDLVMRYDAGTAEEMRDAAMRQFYERQQSRGAGGGTNNPFAPAGMRNRGPAAGPAPARRNDPAAAGSALAARLANKRRREEEEARRAQAAAAPPAAAPTPAAASKPAASASAASPSAKAEPADDGAISRLLARRRQALLAQPEYEPEPEAEEPEEEAPAAATGARHAESRSQRSSLRAVPLEPVDDQGPPSLEDVAASTAARRPAAKAAPARKAAKKAAKARVAKAPAKAVEAAEVVEAPAKRARKAPTAKAPAAKAPAKRARATKAAPKAAAAPAKAPAAKKVGKAKTVFCIECGEKNPAIAKFCFNCGTRLAAPEN